MSKVASYRRWTPAEDEVLLGKIKEFGMLAGIRAAGRALSRSSSSARSRWRSVLDPSLCHLAFTEEEDEIIRTTKGDSDARGKIRARLGKNRSLMSMKNRREVLMRRVRVQILKRASEKKRDLFEVIARDVPTGLFLADIATPRLDGDKRTPVESFVSPEYFEWATSCDW